MAGLSNTIQYKELPAANPRCAVHFEDTKIFVLDHFFKERGKMWRLTIDSNSYLYLSMRRPDVKKKIKGKEEKEGVLVNLFSNFIVKIKS